jgi:hypothetical protein
MSSFTEPLILEALATEQKGRGIFLVHKPFSYDIGYLGSGDTITVPAGFATDLCSVPALARPFIPLAGRMAKPALLHDWLLVQGDPRAHDVFDEALKVAGVRDLTRRAVVAAVRFHESRKRLFRRLFG